MHICDGGAHIKIKGLSKKLHVGGKRKLVAKGGGRFVQELISYFSIRLSHTHVEMDKICLKSIFVITFPCAIPFVRSCLLSFYHSMRYQPVVN